MHGTAQEFQKLANQYNALVLDTWSSWTKQTIQSESFTAASTAMMDWSLANHKVMAELSGQVMETLDIPKRSDLARISSQVQAVETRLLEQEETQEDIRDLLTSLVQKIDSISSKVEASQAQTPAPTAKSKSTSQAKTKSKAKA